MTVVEPNELALRMVVVSLVQELVNAGSLDLTKLVDRIQANAADARGNPNHVAVADSMHRMSQLILQLVHEAQLPRPKEN